MLWSSYLGTCRYFVWLRPHVGKVPRYICRYLSFSLWLVSLRCGQLWLSFGSRPEKGTDITAPYDASLSEISQGSKLISTPYLLLQFLF